jgi:RNA ligase partner protein
LYALRAARFSIPDATPAAGPMQTFVLDTSLFTNPQTYRQFGADAASAVAGFLDLAEDCVSRFYMPTSVYDELRAMVALDGLAARFELTVHIRSPRKYELQIPANILYEFIDEVRTRIDRGLRIAEEHARMGRHGQEHEVGEVIARLRDRYREALRQGIIDSREDADVMLLAYELEAALVSADEGLRKWADKVGVEIVLPDHMRGVLENLSGRG